jgi:hypothetical protein
MTTIAKSNTQNKILGTLQIVLFDFTVEGSFADAEDFGGLLAIAVGFGESFGDGLFFKLIE